LSLKTLGKSVIYLRELEEIFDSISGGALMKSGLAIDLRKPFESKVIRVRKLT